MAGVAFNLRFPRGRKNRDRDIFISRRNHSQRSNSSDRSGSLKKRWRWRGEPCISLLREITRIPDIYDAITRPSSAPASRFSIQPSATVHVFPWKRVQLKRPELFVRMNGGYKEGESLRGVGEVGILREIGFWMERRE